MFNNLFEINWKEIVIIILIIYVLYLIFWFIWNLNFEKVYLLIILEDNLICKKRIV